MKRKMTIGILEAAQRMASIYGVKCWTCGSTRPPDCLNYDNHIHHHGPIECIDRRYCERAKRKRRSL